MALDEKSQKILQFWVNEPNREVSSSELLQEFVYKYRNIVYNNAHKNWVEFKNNKTLKYDRKPKALFSSDYSLHRYLKKMCRNGILKRRKRKNKYHYRPSEKYRLEPLKSYCKELISKCNINNILPFYSTLFYLPNFDIKDISYKKLREIQDHQVEIFFHFSQIQNIFEDTTLKKINEMWQVFLDEKVTNQLVKLYCWFYLINHKMKNDTSLRVDRMLRYDQCQDFNDIIKKNPNEFEKIRNEEIVSWNKKFDRLFFDAVLKFYNENFPKRYYSVLDDWKKIFADIKQKITELEYLEYQLPYFLAVVDSSSIVRDHGIKSEDDNLLYARIHQFDDNDIILEKAYQKNLENNDANTDSLMKKSVNDKNRDFPNKKFFKDNRFSEGFEKELEQLHYKKEILYDELDKLASIFTPPSISKLE